MMRGHEFNVGILSERVHQVHRAAPRNQEDGPDALGGQALEDIVRKAFRIRHYLLSIIARFQSSRFISLDNIAPEPKRIWSEKQEISIIP
jgi:hypothetical protein